MKIDINETMKQIMGYKEKLGEFSLDLYYDDVSQKVPYVAKLHSADYSAFQHHERADCFDTALARTDIFLQDLMLQGKRISDLVPQVIRQRPRGTTSSISINKAMKQAEEKQNRNTPFDYKQLTAVIADFGNRYKNISPNFAAEVTKYKPMFHYMFHQHFDKAIWDIIFFCDYPDYVKQDNEGVAALTNHLRNSLQNDHISVSFSRMQQPSDINAYTDKEKFEQLASEKPSLDTLQHELFSDEEYAKKEFECHGYKFHPKPFVCNRCGAANYAKFVWVEGNRSIQERCACCDSYITCVKYDPRDKGDKISDPFYKP